MIADGKVSCTIVDIRFGARHGFPTPSRSPTDAGASKPCDSQTAGSHSHKPEAPAREDGSINGRASLVLYGRDHRPKRWYTRCANRAIRILLFFPLAFNNPSTTSAGTAVPVPPFLQSTSRNGWANLDLGDRVVARRLTAHDFPGQSEAFHEGDGLVAIANSVAHQGSRAPVTAWVSTDPRAGAAVLLAGVNSVNSAPRAHSDHGRSLAFEKPRRTRSIRVLARERLTAVRPQSSYGFVRLLTRSQRTKSM